MRPSVCVPSRAGGLAVESAVVVLGQVVQTSLLWGLVFGPGRLLAMDPV